MKGVGTKYRGTESETTRTQYISSTHDFSSLLLPTKIFYVSFIEPTILIFQPYCSLMKFQLLYLRTNRKIIICQHKYPSIKMLKGLKGNFEERDSSNKSDKSECRGWGNSL